MDDDCKEYRRNKPQQKLYKPGSGPLRRSGYGTDSKMDNYIVEQSLKNHENDQNNYGSQSSVNSCGVVSSPGSRQKKPEQQLYVPRAAETVNERNLKGNNIRCDNSSHNNRRMPSNKQDKHTYHSNNFARGGPKKDRDNVNNDVNYNNRPNRQVSEPRCASPTYSVQSKVQNERSRDTKSMETSAGRHMSGSGGKPPSGRRNSAGYANDSARNKYMLNMDNIPPRFRKKYLEQTGHDIFDSVVQLNRDNYSSSNSLYNSYNQSQPNTHTSWSQTLPSRGRGRLRENEHFDREKFMNTYMKNYELHSSRRSTPSSSYVNLYEANFEDSQNMNKVVNAPTNIEKDYLETVQSNGINSNEHIHQDVPQEDLDKDESDTMSLSTNPLEMPSLDWTEEVEKSIKLQAMDNSPRFPQKLSTVSSTTDQEPKEAKSMESKRNGKSRRRDKRSSSRGQKNSDRKQERPRKDSNASLPHEAVSSNLMQRDRERRDSHRSNRSSNIGNSRDDLDRWRSIRSYSREQSVEGRIVSQCNSRDVSSHRAVSPRDGDGFRVPSFVPKSANVNGPKKNSSWANGRHNSVERGRHSPAPSGASEAGGGPSELAGAPGDAGGAGGGRRRRSKGGRRKGKGHADPPPAPVLSYSSSNSSNWREEIIESKKKIPQGNQRNRLNSAVSEKSTGESTTSHPGLLVLPQGSINQIQKEQVRGASAETQKTLYDHHNPSKPIIVQTSHNKLDVRMERGMSETCSRGAASNEVNDAARAAKHRALLQEVDRADAILQTHLLCGPLALAKHWQNLADTRNVLHNALQRLLMTDLKYCQSDNTEHQFWKILYYNIIEMLRKSLTQVTPDERKIIVELIITIIEEGNAYFENLVQNLEKTYNFSTEDYINDNHLLPPKGLGYIGLALISVQKLYVFLGDLARYKEQVNETNNFAKSKAWYTKAQQINPKNGRPYNQLAILAIYARRKLDAVYYYMRSLMSSNPFQSARESLLSLFDENTKKYEAAERKRRIVQESSKTENGEVAGNGGPHSLRREVWVRPGGQRTTTVSRDGKDDHLNAMTPVELNKHFIISYLHVHGKLVTKIGMETFHESASSMLRQFRGLLHRQPLPTPSARLLQLTALNMFAVETCSRASASDGNDSRRSAWLECALGVSLLMFGALLERCCALLPAPAHSQHHADALLLLPAIKAWSDWMLCHSAVWNPPPSFENFEMESDKDPWDWLAKLMNILEDLDDKTIELENEPKEGYRMVRLWEDASLAGFTPLMYMEAGHGWAAPPAPPSATAPPSGPPASAPHALEHALRTRKLLFFGTEYLVGVEPPVLKLECASGAKPRYVSAVQRVATLRPHLQHLSEDSEDEELANAVTAGVTSVSDVSGMDGTDEVTRRLLKKKEQLESRKATLDKRRQRMQEILSGGSVSMETEVRPRWLVPDTNCFIDHLQLLQRCTAPYTLAVPLVVISELEGLSRCSRVGSHAGAALAWLLGGAAGARLVTSRGSLLAARGFTAESEEPGRATNDDRVLATALNLHNNIHAAAEAGEEVAGGGGRSVRSVVLLTDDRNLRVKALAADLPTRDLPSFIAWAGLADPTTIEAGVAEKALRQRK